MAADARLAADVAAVEALARDLGRAPKRDELKARLRWGSTRANRALRAYKAEHETEPRPTRDEVTVTGRGDTLEVTSKGRIRTLDELLAAAEVDLEAWVVERWKANSWEGFAKGPDGSLVVETLHQVTAHLKAVTLTDAGRVRAVAAEALAALRSAPPRPIGGPTGARTGRPPATGLLLEVSVPDLHIGKLAWAEATGNVDWNLDEAEGAFRRALGTLLRKASPFSPERALLVVGNDLLHVDGPGNTTTRGTPQDVAGAWQAAFRRALELMQVAVESVAAIAPVEVVTIPGNHATALEHVIGEALAAVYKGHPHVTVDATAAPRKYRTWGQVLLGFAHGHGEAQGDLPAIMAAEAQEAWGRTSVREWHTGHLHQRRSRRRVFDVDELREHHGVAVRILPALCPPDAWHASKGYVGNLRAAEAYVWSREGLEAMLVGRPS